MKIISHKFVKNIPEKIEDDTMYISLEYATAIHKCFCGCGKEVVTPFSPTDWELTFNGETVSLYPSIGNWNFECQSHYWIINNTVKIAPKWTNKEIQRNGKKDKIAKEKFYKQKRKNYFFDLFKKNK